MEGVRRREGGRERGGRERGGREGEGGRGEREGGGERGREGEGREGKIGRYNYFQGPKFWQNMKNKTCIHKGRSR